MGDDEGVRLMHEDETRIFTGFVTESALLMDETVLLEGQAPIKVFTLSRRVNGKSNSSFQDTFRRYSADTYSAGISRELRRLSFSLVVEHEYTKSTQIHADAVGEFSFDSIYEATRFFTSNELTDVRSRHKDAICLDEMIIATRENVFFDPENGIDQRSHMIATYLLPG